jgi:hypothetical protein
MDVLLTTAKTPGPKKAGHTPNARSVLSMQAAAVHRQNEVYRGT